jgi:hypothetical protein
MLLFALVRAIEILGEPASKVSAETRKTAPNVAWSQITAMRNRLIHAYFDIDRDILWKEVLRPRPGAERGPRPGVRRREACHRDLRQPSSRSLVKVPRPEGRGASHYRGSAAARFPDRGNRVSHQCTADLPGETMTLAPSDAAPYAQFILRHLLKPLPTFPGAIRGVSETEIPIEGDNWFWADDNAKVLEFLATPDIWRAWPGEVLDILQFVRSLCDGPFIFRRIASPRLELRHSEGGRAEYLHGLMNIGCDLAHGSVTLGMRFHDGRTARNVVMTGNYVRFCYRQRVYTVDVEDSIHDYGIETTADGLRLTWRAELDFPLTPGGWPRRRLGLLTYTCTIPVGSMFVDLEAALEIAPGLEVSDVVLTFGYDDLSQNDNNVRYENIRAAFPAAPPLLASAEGRERFDLSAGGATYWCVAQRSQISGFALAVHSLPRDPARMHALVGTCRSDRLHWLVSEHLFPGSHCGARLITAERKIITAGGFYDSPELYAATLARYSQAATPGGSPIDLSISYDYGTEVNAFARCFRVLSGDAPPVVDPALRETLRTLVDHFHEVYQTQFVVPARSNAGVIFSRSIAFMAFAYVNMLSATGEARYATALREACDIIMTFERQNEGVDRSRQSGFLMGQENDSLPYVDCHCACLLALTKATALLDEQAWVPAIDRGLAAFRLDTLEIFFLGTQKQDLVGVDYTAPDGHRHTLHTFWNFNAGLALRLFNALRTTPHATLREIWARHAPRLEPIEMLMRHRIGRSLRPRDGSVEILTSMLSAETNSETQPWVALALINDDARL